MKVAAIFGGPSGEHDVSVLTGLQVVIELANSNHDVLPLYWSKSGDWHLVGAELEADAFIQGVPQGSESVTFTAEPGGGFSQTGSGRFAKSRKLDVEVVVNCCHGGPGEDGSLQAALDLAGIAYTGPSLAGAALGMDKAAFGAMASAVGLPCLPRQVLAADIPIQFRSPFIIKPRFGGSSIGIEIVEDYETALALLNSSLLLRQGAVIEPYYAEAFDLALAIRTYPDLQMSPIERPIRSQESSTILGYADKYVGAEGMVSAPREIPANIPTESREIITNAAIQISKVAMVRGVARLDFLCVDDAIYVNEINTIPGSLAKHLWIDPPLSFADLLNGLIQEAIKKPAASYNTMGADSTALQSAGSIASKLN